jgi:uncharacterized protein YdhG (YjbR/CyaY superfamily)
MPMPAPQVDEYLSQLDPQRRAAVAELRSLIVETVTSAAESMRYKMPTYGYEAAILSAFAPQDPYISLYVEPESWIGTVRSFSI